MKVHRDVISPKNEINITPKLVYLDEGQARIKIKYYMYKTEIESELVNF